jgi:hypothetical protein
MSAQKSLSTEPEVLSLKPGDIMVIKPPHHLTQLQREKIEQEVMPIAEQHRCSLLVLGADFDMAILPDMGRITQVLERQAQAMEDQAKATTQATETCAQFLAILLQMIESEQDEPDEDGPPGYYMDGTKIN